jgi:tetratricopeptide (TPR) repeat protein
MSDNKLKITISDVRAEKDTQILLKRSNLEYSDDVKRIASQLDTQPNNPELWMKKGLALAKQMLFREATEAFSTGLTYDPFNWLLLRHRGHRHISTYRFEDAAADFELASRINNKDWDVWYHLGLSYYLIGDFNRANNAYDRCMEITNMDDINLVAIVDWKWLTLNILGRREEASAILSLVDESTEAGENQAYKDRILVYKGLKTPEEAMQFDNEEFSDLEYATRGYGVAMYHYFSGNKSKAKEIMEKILERDTFWTAFGYLGAYQDLNKGRLDF